MNTSIATALAPTAAPGGAATAAIAPPLSTRAGRTSGFTEKPAWQGIRGTWRLLYGGFAQTGVSVEHHDFTVENAFDWARTFHPGSLEICLNLNGRGTLAGADHSMVLEPMTAAIYAPGKSQLRAWRLPGQPHRFITLEMSPRFLRRQLASCDGALHPLVARLLEEPSGAFGLGEIHRLTTEQERVAASLPQSPVCQAARGLWYQSKILELMVQFLFRPQLDDESFCDRQKRVARTRVERVIAILRASLTEPPALEEIGRKVGCSPFYLSRTFSQEMGMTIPQYLRKIRMEHAAALLRSGKYNVTEAALEAGYSSLSHFSQAFCQTMGCCPGLYPLQSNAAS